MRLALALGLPLALLVLGWFLITPSPRQHQVDPGDLPWNLVVDGPQRVRVFGLSIGESTLADSDRRFGVEAEAGVFRDPGGKLSVEAYYDSLTLAGLKAKLVLELRASVEELEGFEAATIRRIGLRSGAVRLELPSSYDADLRKLSIRSLTYAPRVDIEAETLRERFGEPERIVQLDERRSHWLYPQRGLDILVDSDGREVIQYLLPAEFERLLELLAPA